MPVALPAAEAADTSRRLELSANIVVLKWQARRCTLNTSTIVVAPTFSKLDVAMFPQLILSYCLARTSSGLMGDWTIWWKTQPPHNNEIKSSSVFNKDAHSLPHTHYSPNAIQNQFKLFYDLIFYIDEIWTTKTGSQ